MKCWIITKTQLKRLGAACLIGALALAAGGTAVRSAAAGERLLPIYCVDTPEKKVAISFDAAWGADDTDELIAILERYGVKTTFFVVGQWADQFPQEVKRLSDAGHEVMNHSDTHPYFSKISRDEVVDEVTACDAKIEAITGVKPTLVRPPYGDYDNKSIEALESTGHYAIQWSVDSLDWKEISAEEILQRVKSKVCPGSIILFHNAALHTPEALPQVLEYLQGEGYEVVPVSKLIYTGEFTIDHEGKQEKVKKQAA